MHKCNVIRWLSAVTLAFLIVVSFTSCALFSSFESIRNTLTDKPSEFDRYLDYLDNINEDHTDEYDGYGYNAYVYPVKVQDEICLNLAGITHALGGDDGMRYSLVIVLIIPESLKETHFGFSLSRYAEDGTATEVVKASGVLNNAEYNGNLPAFTEYTNIMEKNDDGKEHYREMATKEMNRLLAAAEKLLARAELTLSTLGFTYRPEVWEENQVVISIKPQQSILFLSKRPWGLGEICNSHGGLS